MSEFKVIIAGGGVTALVLANMLEMHGMDYVVLESHSAIAPQVGASIGLFINGLRILDQMGLFESIQAIFADAPPSDTMHMRRPDGTIISSLTERSSQLEKRYGYGLYFFDRQQLLQILYDNLKHKDRVLLKKKVSDIKLAPGGGGGGGVTVHCTDGTVFAGTIAVGADGVHSIVRAAMRRLAAALEPGYFDAAEAETEVVCHYRCSFGIAKHVPGWQKGADHTVTGHGRSQLIVTGPQDKVYWFLCDRLPEPRYGSDIPSYSREDEARFAERNYDLPVTEEFTFGQIYEHGTVSALTPLHEYVYKKWFFREIITLGDSAHKPNPMGGQGANGAIESCAELLNAFVRLGASRGERKLEGLSTAEITRAFAETQARREARAQQLVRESHELQSLLASESPLKTKLVLHYISPILGQKVLLGRLGKKFLGASRLDSVPLPYRPKEVLFDDERAERGDRDSAAVKGLVWGGAVGALGVGIVLAVKTYQLWRPHLTAN
ncbi:monooxygenase [Apiospora phragmitis]|uniref:Monooxygenase n=1 Tax=Apiospora phragmitis TaxID=2905665 RepID=A0ABR1VFL4_9PEZI